MAVTRKDVTPETMEAALRIIHRYEPVELERRLAVLNAADEVPLPIRLRSSADLKWAYERGLISRNEARSFMGLPERRGFFADLLGPRTATERPH